MYTRTIQVFINLPDLINVTHVSPFHKYMQCLRSVPFKILLSKQFVWIVVRIWKKGWCFPLPCQVLGWHFPKRVKSKLLWNAKPLCVGKFLKNPSVRYLSLWFALGQWFSIFCLLWFQQNFPHYVPILVFSQISFVSITMCGPLNYSQRSFTALQATS